jgi:hypothetical protein
VAARYPGGVGVSSSGVWSRPRIGDVAGLRGPVAVHVNDPFFSLPVLLSVTGRPVTLDAVS